MFGLKISTNFPFLTRAAQHDMPARERPFPAAPDSDLAGRAVPGNALSDWYLALPELLERALAEDEETLLNLAFDWLKFALFGEKSLKMRPEVEAAAKARAVE